MKDLKKLAKIAIEELRAIDIPIDSSEIDWKVNKRAKSRWGRCKRESFCGIDSYTIEIASILLEDDISYIATMETIIHELLHTWYMDHGPKWKALAEKVNSFYPQYNITVTSSCEDKGIEKDRLLGSKKYRWVVSCKECAHEFKYVTESKVVKILKQDPHGCKCPYCNKHNFTVKSL